MGPGVVEVGGASSSVCTAVGVDVIGVRGDVAFRNGKMFSTKVT